VARTAESAVIRTAYRKLVLKWHPDKNPGKEEASATMTARLNNAYEILMNSVQRRDFEERFFGAATPAPEAAARPASAPGSAPPASRGARPGAQGMGEHDQEENGHAEGVDAEPTSSFDPRRPGKSWRAWGRGRGTTRGAHDAHAGPQSFAEAAWQQAAHNAEHLYNMPDPYDSKHRKTTEAGEAREQRQREKADKFEGYRNKQQKRAAKRELRQRATVKGEQRKLRREQEAQAAAIAARQHSEAAGDLTDASHDPAMYAAAANNFVPFDPRTWRNPTRTKQTKVEEEEAEDSYMPPPPADASTPSETPKSKEAPSRRAARSRDNERERAIERERQRFSGGTHKARARFRTPMAAGMQVKNGCLWC